MTKAMVWATQESAATPLENLLSETGFDWARTDTRFAAHLKTCTVVAEQQDQHVAFQVELTPLRNPSPQSLAAITGFLGALNSRLR